MTEKQNDSTENLTHKEKQLSCGIWKECPSVVWNRLGARLWELWDGVNPVMEALICSRMNSLNQLGCSIETNA